MNWLINILLPFIVGLPFIVESASNSVEQKLIRHLMLNSNKLVRPVMLSDHPTTVTVHMELIQILDIDETKQELTCKFWTTQVWTNELMRWNASEWGGITRVTVHAHKIWVPDLTLYNNAGNSPSAGVDLYKTSISMHSNGTHEWLAPALYRSTCQFDITHFPFDAQECHLKFGSWLFDSSIIKLRASNSPVIPRDFVPSSEWELLDAFDTVQNLYYDHHGSYYDYIVYIRCKRHALTYIFNMLLPCVVLLLVTVFSFYLPPESGERITVVSTNLLTMAIFLMMTNEVLPHNSNSVAAISIFYISLMAESAFSLFMSYCVLAVHHQSELNFPGKIPPSVRLIFLQTIGKVLGYYEPKCRRVPRKIKRVKRHLIPQLTQKKTKKQKKMHGLHSAFQMMTSESPCLEKLPLMAYCDQSGFKITNKVSSLQSKMSSLESNLSSLQANVSSLEANKSSLQANLDGNRKMRRNRKTNCIAREQEFNFQFNYFVEKEDYSGNKLNQQVLQKILSNVNQASSHVMSCRSRKVQQEEWKILGTILDRVYLFTFIVMVTTTILGVLSPAFRDVHLHWKTISHLN